jgi:hypothetical protein
MFLFVMAPSAALAETAEIITKMKQDVLELKREVEKYEINRCTSGLYDCYRNNYEHCKSTLPNPTCPTSEEFIIKECNSCGARFSLSNSTVHLSEKVEVDLNGNPIDPKVREQE